MELVKHSKHVVGFVVESDRDGNEPASRPKWLRILVDVSNEGGKKFWLQYKYEKLGAFCYHCGRFNHTPPPCRPIGNEHDSGLATTMVTAGRRFSRKMTTRPRSYFGEEKRAIWSPKKTHWHARCHGCLFWYVD
ncbi:hypothetical protein G4B88_001379 [Cannabis sativa]|uniref:Zinc knuckle CX2CX4HX4C domain-containing protein n=1 Tax=Cannabis sativa TaxID=3483 RepID=A0A7J6F9J6_CANSA|nr:hypothetical protein G4B88_001379 [Cannabis sativa]